jgi:DNA-binding GntR family transcriptional regulator
METMEAKPASQNYPKKTGTVYELLREKILARDFLPGERLIERDLVQNLGVSSTTVREALTRLAKDGLVSILPYRGACVTKLSEKDIVEIYELREQIEGLAARWAAERVSKEQIQQLKSRIKSSERHITGARGNYYDALNELNSHHVAAKMSANIKLHKIIHDLYNQSRLLISASLAHPDRTREAFEEEKKVLEAIIARDPDSAEQYAKAHVRNAKRVTLALNSDRTERRKIGVNQGD